MPFYSKMAGHCGQSIEVVQTGVDWKTCETCSAGHEVGLPASELLDRCVGCAKSTIPNARTVEPPVAQGGTMLMAGPSAKIAGSSSGKVLSMKERKENERSWTTDDGFIYKLDAIDLLRRIPDESIDLAIFDPAYESLEKWRGTGTTTRLKNSKSSSNKWFDLFPNDSYPLLFKELFRVMKKGTHIYMMCDEETRDIICTGYSPQTNKQWFGKSPLIDAGFKYWKTLTWDKVVPGMGYHYRAQKEEIIFAEKVVRKNAHRQLNDRKTSDVLPVQRLKGKQKNGEPYYPTEKPVPLLWKLINQSSEPGDTVLDMFCGSGSTGRAARISERRFILGDIDPSEAVARLV